MGEVRQRWPAEAARDPKWVTLDAAHRSRYTGEAVWKQRHSDAASARKLRYLAYAWPAIYVLRYIPGAAAYLAPLTLISIAWAIVIEAMILAACEYYKVNHWRKERGLTWTKLVLAFFPDSAYEWWQRREKEKRAGSAEREARAPSVGPSAPGTASKTDAGASPAGTVGTAGSPRTLLPPTNYLPPPQQPPQHWTGRSTVSGGSPHPLLGTGGVSMPQGGGAYSAGLGGHIGWGGGGGGITQSPQPLFGGSPRMPAFPLATPGTLPTPDVCRSLAYGSPHSGRDAFCAGFADQNGDFKFRASPMTLEKPAVPLAQLVDDSYRAILRLTNKESTSLLAEGSTLQRDIFSHLVLLDKQITEVEKGIKDMKEFHGLNMQQFSCAHPLTEPLERAEPPPPAAAPAMGGFGGGGFGGFGGFGAKPQQPQPEQKKEEGLRNVLAPLSTELNAWGGDRPGKGDRIRMKQILLKRLRLERALCIENNFPATAHPMEYDTAASRMKQNRAQRQKFIARLKGIVSEGYHEGRRDTNDAEIVLHALAALLDVSYFGARANLAVEWSGAGRAILRYTNNRCPGFLQLNVESTSCQGMTIYVVKHVDSDLGVNTTYFTNPSRSLYEALYFFLLIFESKHPNKPHATIDHDSCFSGSQSLFAYLSRQFMLESNEAV